MLYFLYLVPGKSHEYVQGDAGVKRKSSASEGNDDERPTKKRKASAEGVTTQAKSGSRLRRDVGSARKDKTRRKSRPR